MKEVSIKIVFHYKDGSFKVSVMEEYTKKAIEDAKELINSLVGEELEFIDLFYAKRNIHICTIEREGGRRS